MASDRPAVLQGAELKPALPEEEGGPGKEVNIFRAPSRALLNWMSLGSFESKTFESWVRIKRSLQGSLYKTYMSRMHKCPRKIREEGGAKGNLFVAKVFDVRHQSVMHPRHKARALVSPA